MKKLFSRNLVVMLAAVALVTAALVTSCNSPIEGKVPGEREDDFTPFDPPAGMGYIRIKVANNGRTIIPSLPAVNTLAYHIVVTDDDDNDTPVYDSNDVNTNKPILFSDLTTNPIVIIPGNYTVLVIAYTNTTGTPLVYDQLVGDDLVDGVTVGTSGETVDIHLKPKKATGSGTFSYNIALPSNKNLSEGTFGALLTVTTYPGKAATTITNVNLTTGSNNNNTATPTSLASGFYYVNIVMTDPGTPAIPGTPADTPNPGDPAIPEVPAVPPALQNKTVTNILYIYQNIKTDYGTAVTPITLDDLNLFRYTVTYDGNDGIWQPGSATSITQTNIAHGSTLTTPTPPVQVGYTLTGWILNGFTNATLPIEWVFGVSGTTIIGPVTLNATWLKQDTLNLNIDWKSDPSTPPSVTSTPSNPTFTHTNYWAGTTQEITITVNNLGSYEVVDWYYNGVGSPTPLGTTANSIILTNDPNNSLPGKFFDIRYLAVGTHSFTLVVEKPGVLPADPPEDVQSIDFTFTVTN